MRPARARPSTPVLPAQPLDLLVGHGRGPVRVEELARVPRPEVVLQGPDSCREVLPRIAKPGSAYIDEPAQHAVLDQHVRKTVVPMHQDVVAPGNAERAAGGVGGVDAAPSFSQGAGHAGWRPRNRRVVKRYPGKRAS